MPGTVLGTGTIALSKLAIVPSFLEQVVQFRVGGEQTNGKYVNNQANNEDCDRPMMETWQVRWYS